MICFDNQVSGARCQDSLRTDTYYMDLTPGFCKGGCVAWGSFDLEKFPSLCWEDAAPFASREIRGPLERVLERQDGACLNTADCYALARSEGSDLIALLVAGDVPRRELAGNIVTYVVNRNINFTN